MAAVFIIDLSEPLSVLSNGWQCAAEMAGCVSEHQALELLAGTASTPFRVADETPSAPSRTISLRAFPLAVMASNKYFTVPVQVMVGELDHTDVSAAATRSSSPHSLPPLQLPGSMQQCASPQGGHARAATADTPFGCVFVVSAEQSPETLPWHLARSSASLFSAVLVRTEARAVGGERARSQPISHDALRVWELACVDNYFECIPWPRAGAPSDSQWEVVPPGVGVRGLLEGSVYGSARVAQVLCNTLWPSTVRTPASASTTTTANTANTLIVIGGGSERYLEEMWRTLTLPSWRHASAAEHSVFAGLCAQSAQDDRFLTLHDSSAADCPSETLDDCTTAATAHTQTGARASTCSERVPGDKEAPVDRKGPRDPFSLLLVNKYYGARVHPSFLHAALFDAAMTDVVSRELERALAGCHESAPALVFWPPNGGTDWGGHTAPADSRFAYPPLASVLARLRQTHRVGDIVVVTAAHALSAFHAMAGTTAPVHTATAAAIPTTAALSALCATDGLDSFEQQCCVDAGVEVIPLLPAAVRVGARDVGTSTQTWASSDVDGPAGTDRLREVLHCQEWPCCEAVHAASSGLSEAVDGVNVCLLVACGASAEIEESWVRHLLAHTLRPASCAARARRRPLLSAVPSLAFGAEGCVLPVRNKYISADVFFFLDGGLRTRWLERGGAEESARPNPPHVSVAITSVAVLRRCATRGDCPDSAADPHEHRFTELLRAAQRLLAEDWARAECQKGEGTEVEQHGQGIPTCGTADRSRERVCLLYVVDLDDTDEAQLQCVEDALSLILFGERGTDTQDERVPFPLIEIVSRDRDGAHASTLDGFATTGCARVLEALQQYPSWTPAPPREDTATSCPASGQSHGARSAASDDSPARTRPTAESSVAVGGAQEPPAAPCIGCALPAHYLIDPLSLRSGAVAALLYFQAAPRARKADTPAPPDGEVAAEAEITGRGAVVEQALKRELLGWVERMSVHGHRLPHDVRQRQAAVLALVVDRLAD